jgi:hypothetical protein
MWETVLSLLPEEPAKALESSIQEARPDNDAVKAAVAQNDVDPGTEVRRGTHLRGGLKVIEISTRSVPSYLNDLESLMPVCLQ